MTVHKVVAKTQNYCMKKITGLLFCCCYCSIVFAQTFHLPKPKGSAKTPFTKAFVKLLNEAPHQFKKYKGKLLTGKDDLHLGSVIFKSKLQLEGSIRGRLVSDSTHYMEFFYGDYATLDEATNKMDDLTQQVQTALGNNAYFHHYPIDSNGTVVQQTKIAFTRANGFFHFNISLQLVHLQNQQYRILLQVYHGRPIFYRKIFFKPVSSFLFVNEMHKNLEILHKNRSKTCPVEMVGFYCDGKTVTRDSAITRYTTETIDNELSATMRFDMVLTNLQVSLNTDYVYYELPTVLPYKKRYAFIKIADIEKRKRPSVILSMVQNTTTNDTTKTFNILMHFATAK